MMLMTLNCMHLKEFLFLANERAFLSWILILILGFELGFAPGGLHHVLIPTQAGS
jgi:hypothetical protein